MGVISSNLFYVLLVELVISNEELRLANTSVNVYIKPPLTPLEWLESLHFTYTHDFSISEEKSRFFD
jgi:hypothetical protein